MCAIAGIHAYHYAGNAVDRGELGRIADRMAQRGPDGQGVWYADNGRCGLAHRRLAVIDVDGCAQQPMVSCDGRYVVTFNGQIYNHRALRHQLELEGWSFRTNSDTEVLLKLYCQVGEEAVHRLRGMFAFAVWDNDAQSLFLARDPFGIKPLYYADDGWTFRFASSVKALLAGGALSSETDPAGLVGFFLLGSVPEPFTINRSIQCLPAGSTLRVNRVGASAVRHYYDVGSVYRDGEKNKKLEPEWRERARAALRDSVANHLVSDVPVGVFLSGGLDSGAIVGLMTDLGVGDIPAVTVGFETAPRSRTDEPGPAASVARRYGAAHTVCNVTRRDFERDMAAIIEAMDQPSIDGVNIWFAAKAARERGLKAVISGIGGDELFGGYPSFRSIPWCTRVCAVPGRVPMLGRALRPLLLSVCGWTGLSPKAASVVEFGATYAGAYLLRRGLFMPWELTRLLDRDVVSAGMRRLKPLGLISRQLARGPRGAFARVAALETTLYMRNQLLRDADWAGMAHAVEIRTPLVDRVLLAELARLAPACRRFRKSVLADAPARALPAHVRQRGKTGFVVPLDDWLQPRGELRGVPRHGLTGQTHWSRSWSQLITAPPPLGPPMRG